MLAIVAERLAEDSSGDAGPHHFRSIMQPQATGKVWAIGDIHGQATLLDLLLHSLPRAPHDTTVFLGDYIDRGPDSREVVERLLREHDHAPDRTILLWGNHEAIAAAYFGVLNPLGWQFEEPVHAHDGLQATLDSFGISVASGERPTCPQPLQRLFSLLQLVWRCPARGHPARAAAGGMLCGGVAHDPQGIHALPRRFRQAGDLWPHFQQDGVPAT